MNAERPEQYRGVTYLAQIIEPLLQTRRYTESEITAAIVESFFTAFIKTKTDQDEFPLNEVGKSENSRRAMIRTNMRWGPAM
ncbi:MAG: phage portal protein [Gallintestinimicrobium sp.]